MIYVYLLVAAFQWSWLGGWAPALVAACVFAYLGRPSRPRETPDWVAFGIAALPVLAVFVWRMPFPDRFEDLFNYHLANAVKGFGATPFPVDEFQVTRLNPLPDMAFTPFRHILGYRLGTLPSLTSLLWCAAILERWLRKTIVSPWQRGLAIALGFMSEGLYLQIAGYAIDLLAIPLLLESLEEERDSRFGVLAGLMLALKITNAAFVIPVAAHRLWLRRRDGRAWLALIGIPVLILFPYHWLAWRATGNPIYPVLNNVFRSPIDGLVSHAETRFGPRKWLEKIAWPLYMPFYPRRGWELFQYSGRMAAGFLLAALRLLGVKLAIPRRLAAYVIASSFLWAISAGNIRYALALDVIGAFFIVVATAGWRWPILFAHAVYAGYAFFPYVDPFHRTADELRWSTEVTKIFESYPTRPPALAFAEGWVSCLPGETGDQLLLAPRFPLIVLRNERGTGSVATAQAALAHHVGKRMFAIAHKHLLTECFDAISTYGLKLGEVIPISNRVYFFEIRHPSQTGRTPEQVMHDEAAVFPPGLSLNRAELELLSPPPLQLRRGERARLRLRVRNVGSIAWQPKERFPVRLGARWFDHEMNMLADDRHITIAAPIAPGETVDMTLPLAPARGPGDYLLSVDMLSEGAAWFGDRGSRALSFAVSVR